MTLGVACLKFESSLESKFFAVLDIQIIILLYYAWCAQGIVTGHTGQGWQILCQIIAEVFMNDLE